MRPNGGERQGGGEREGGGATSKSLNWNKGRKKRTERSQNQRAQLSPLEMKRENKVNKKGNNKG